MCLPSPSPDLLSYVYLSFWTYTAFSSPSAFPCLNITPLYASTTSSVSVLSPHFSITSPHLPCTHTPSLTFAWPNPFYLPYSHDIYSFFPLPLPFHTFLFYPFTSQELPSTTFSPVHFLPSHTSLSLWTKTLFLFLHISTLKYFTFTRLHSFLSLFPSSPRFSPSLTSLLSGQRLFFASYMCPRFNISPLRVSTTSFLCFFFSHLHTFHLPTPHFFLDVDYFISCSYMPPRSTVSLPHIPTSLFFFAFSNSPLFTFLPTPPLPSFMHFPLAW